MERTFFRLTTGKKRGFSLYQCNFHKIAQYAAISTSPRALRPLSRPADSFPFEGNTFADTFGLTAFSISRCQLPNMTIRQQPS